MSVGRTALRALLTWLVLAPAWAPGPAVAAATVSADSRLLLQFEALWMTAMRRRDRGELNRYMSANFQLGRFGNGGDSPTSRRAWIDGALHHQESQSFDLERPGTQIIGNIGIVTSDFHWIGTMDGVPFERRGRLVDTWERRRGTWFVISRIVLE